MNLDQRIYFFHANASIAQALMNLDLVDEYHLMLHPLPIGKGKPLFKNMKNRQKLEPIQSEAYKNGVFTLYCRSDMTTKKNAPEKNFLSALSAPARRALENNGIKSIDALSKFTEKEILKLHGIGKSAIPILKIELAKNGLAFKEGKGRSK